MSMQFLSATTDVQGIHYSIWLDTSKTEADGTTPDPAYIFVRDWPPAPADWVGGATVYQAMTLTEIKLLAQHKLNEINAPTPAPTNLSVLGTTF